MNLPVPTPPLVSAPQRLQASAGPPAGEALTGGSLRTAPAGPSLPTTTGATVTAVVPGPGAPQAPARPSAPAVPPASAAPPGQPGTPTVATPRPTTTPELARTGVDVTPLLLVAVLLLLLGTALTRLRAV